MSNYLDAGYDAMEDEQERKHLLEIIKEKNAALDAVLALCVGAWKDLNKEQWNIAWSLVRRKVEKARELK